MITDTNIINTSVNKYPLLTRVVFFLSVFLLCTSLIIVHAETITYDVCESGCEYATLQDVSNNINSFEDSSNVDIIININSDYSHNALLLGSERRTFKSLTINGNNHVLNSLVINVNDLEVEVNEMNTYENIFLNLNKLTINNSKLDQIALLYNNGDFENYSVNYEEINLNEVLEIDDISLKNIFTISISGNVKMENMNFKDNTILCSGGKINIYSSQISKIISIPDYTEGETNIYNSKFDSLKYKRITSKEEYDSELSDFEGRYSTYKMLPYNIYDIDIENYNEHSNVMVYFDKELEIKTNETIDLINHLDYYTEDKEIDYVIEDESIAKIEGLALTGLKEGQTNITVTTDDEHVVYRIKLNVIKEIEIPPSGINIKTSALIIGVGLLGIVGVCIYLLIKAKKKK